MLTYVIRRLLYSIPVLAAASFLIFAGVTSIGDPLNEIRRNPRISEATIQNIVERKHLDRPLLVQYGHWIKDVVTDNFGTTLIGDRPIWPDLKRVMGNTLQLIIAALILALLIAIGVGVLSAVKQYSIFDHAATTFSFITFSTPIFWLALMLQVIFTNIFLATEVRIFYTAGISSPGCTIGFWSLFASPACLLDRFQHLGLPVIALGLLYIAQFSRFLRASMLEVINSDYVRTARAKGLRERRVTMKHAFRNALIPLTTVVALESGALFGGAIITETIFSIDGMGNYFIRNLFQGDIYPLMAWLLVVGVIVIAFNLLADILYGFLDPRIRYD